MPEPSRRALQLPPAAGRRPLTTDNQMRPQPPLQQPTGGRRSWRAHGEASVGSSVAGGVAGVAHGSLYELVPVLQGEV
eukprot:COSAG01_NODE_587_length_15149_cov_13.592558_1_plen_77_part_10